MTSNRFLIVPEDSSAARIPLPGATIAFATLFNASRFMFPSIAIPLSPPGCLDLLAFEHLDTRQRLALEPFEERAASGRDIGEPVGAARRVQSCHRIAAPGNRDELAGLREL